MMSRKQKYYPQSLDTLHIIVNLIKKRPLLDNYYVIIITAIHHFKPTTKIHITYDYDYDYEIFLIRHKNKNST